MNFFPQCQLSPLVGDSAELCEAIGASLRTQVRIIFACMTHFYFSFYIRKRLHNV